MSSGDILVYDMASQSEGTPEVFVQKSWLSILDKSKFKIVFQLFINFFGFILSFSIYY